MIIITGFILFGLLMAATFPPASTSCLFTMVAIISLVFLDSRTAFFSYNVAILGAAIVATFPSSSYSCSGLPE